MIERDLGGDTTYVVELVLTTFNEVCSRNTSKVPRNFIIPSHQPFAVRSFFSGMEIYMHMIWQHLAQVLPPIRCIVIILINFIFSLFYEKIILRMESAYGIYGHHKFLSTLLVFLLQTTLNFVSKLTSSTTTVGRNVRCLGDYTEFAERSTNKE